MASVRGRRCTSPSLCDKQDVVYNVASGFILIIGNFTTMNKFILVIAMVCCITQLCSRFNAIYGTKHHIDMLDSISTNFARENTIYRGVRLWSMFNNPNKNYLCIKVNDTLIIVTDSELLFDTPLYSTTKERQASYTALIFHSVHMLLQKGIP